MVKDFHEEINVPKAYLSKLLQELARQKLISSVRGRKGGFYLSEANRNEPLIRFINVIDGRSRMTSCMLSLDDCRYHEPCPLHNIYEPARAKLIRSLAKITIHALTRDLRLQRTFLPR